MKVNCRLHLSNELSTNTFSFLLRGSVFLLGSTVEAISVFSRNEDGRGPKEIVQNPRFNI